MKHSQKAVNNSAQKAINDAVERAVERFNNSSEKIIAVYPLRYCQAKVYEYPSFYVLQSYHTIIALIEKSTGICYDFLRWAYGYTSTSNQHISKFRADYCKSGEVYCWRYI